uniref:Uncharacterized protein n=1 Tax=Glossina pallidipes TaxID=7398 RepID=A0A1B0A2Q6_GLOPL
MVDFERFYCASERFHFFSQCKILLYPEEGWARTASSSYWTITLSWWQPNRCRIEEFAGTQRKLTKAKMVALEQKGSLLIAGHFHDNNKHHLNASRKGNDEFRLYLTSNVSKEDYNMGYCLTGFVERRCQETNTFQMTHFAVIKRQWPSLNQEKTNNNVCVNNSFYGMTTASNMAVNDRGAEST